MSPPAVFLAVADGGRGARGLALIRDRASREARLVARAVPRAASSCRRRRPGAAATSCGPRSADERAPRQRKARPWRAALRLPVYRPRARMSMKRRRGNRAGAPRKARRRRPRRGRAAAIEPCSAGFVLSVKILDLSGAGPRPRRRVNPGASSVVQSGSVIQSGLAVQAGLAVQSRRRTKFRPAPPETRPRVKECLIKRI